MKIAFLPREKRRLEELSPAEIARLCLLNDRLIEAEAWIHERARQCLSAYYATRNVNRHIQGRVIENVEIDAKVTCVLQPDHPEFREDNDCIIAELDALTRSIEVIDTQFTFAEFGAPGEQPPLADVRLCYLFHDLIDHKLDRDFDRALHIGELWIDVKLTQQRIIGWNATTHSTH
ncbi:hypothetical protein [Paraburkholderia sp. 2C]